MIAWYCRRHASLYYEKGWFGTLDGTLTVNFNDSFSAVLEATNILDETSRVRYMPIDLTAFNTDFGRRVLVDCARASDWRKSEGGQ